MAVGGYEVWKLRILEWGTLKDAVMSDNKTMDSEERLIGNFPLPPILIEICEVSDAEVRLREDLRERPSMHLKRWILS